MGKNFILKYSFLLYLLFVAVRLFGLFSFDIQPDEVHWLERSQKVISLYKAHKFTHLTTHLGQPGVVPALIMAVGSGVGEVVNSRFGINPGDPFYMHPLYLCRLSCLLVSSLIVFPLMFIGSLFFEVRVMVLACLLLAFSPHHIGLSRMAHLDAVMTVTVVTSILFYLKSLKTGIQKYKLYAGLFWGLSIATKPTALSLVIAFLLLGAFSSYYVKQRGLRETVSIYDFWAILIGHIIFALLYTRIWVHESDYLLRLHIHSRFADFIYFIGTTYRGSGLALMILALLYGLYRYQNTKIKSYLALIFVTSLGSLVFLCPVVVEGLIRYWTWTLGLSKTPHHAYGKVWKPVEGGYLSLLLFELPLTILFLVSFNFLELIYRALRSKFNSQDRKRAYLFFIFILWVAVLSVSSKQTLRYILPVLPCLYVLAGDSIWRLFELIKAKVNGLSHYGYVFSACFMVPQMIAVVSTHPNQVMFYNALGGGVDGVVTRGGAHYLLGINELVTFLRHDVAKSEKLPISVYVGGEVSVPKVAHQILFPGEKDMKFLPFSSLMWGSYFIRFHHLDSVFLKDVPSGLDIDMPRYTAKIGSHVVLSLYKVNTPSFNLPNFFETSSLHKSRGKVVRLCKANEKSCEVEPGVFQRSVIELTKGAYAKGFANISSEVRLEKGSYELGFYVRKMEETNVRTPAFEIQFGNCKQVVYSDELSLDIFNLSNSTCKLEKDRYLSFKVYWFGKVNMELGLGRLVRIREGG